MGRAGVPVKSRSRQFVAGHPGKKVTLGRDMTSEKMRIKKSVSPCGLYYIENFLSADEATNLISDIDKRKWSGHGIA